MLNTAQVRQIFERFQAQCTEPKTELIYDSSFQLLIAVILSAQATDVSVNKATAELFRVAPTVLEMNALSEEELRAYISRIGLYRAKAKHIKQTCQMLIDEFGGEVPQDRESLQQLSGVGRKTANVVLNTVFGQPCIAVDTHIFRVSRRMGLSAGTNVYQVEEDLMEAIPTDYQLNAHHWLILHGRYVCKARKPSCENCVIHDLCCQKFLSAELD